MTYHVVAEGFGYLGAALGVAMVVPQVLRTLAHRGMPGVSALSWALTATSCTGWLMYGVRTGELPQIPGNVLLVSGAVAIVLLVPSGVSVRGRAGRLVAAALVLGAVASVAPAPLLGAVAFGIGMVSGVPQILRSVRRSGEDSALSLLTWMLRVACQTSWLIFAISVHDITVLVSAVFLLTSALVVVVSEVSRRPAPALVAA